MAQAPSGTKFLTGAGGNGHLVIPRSGNSPLHSKRAGPSQYLMDDTRDVLSNNWCVLETPQSVMVSHCKLNIYIRRDLGSLEPGRCARSRTPATQVLNPETVRATALAIITSRATFFLRRPRVAPVSGTSRVDIHRELWPTEI